ncbi:jacalin-like lectin [Brevibacillus laterosporus]|uniref:jacalin-like lectin n=1 Tax=Brevibacillus laterosporus TaxID=1465 RepID=UPI000CE5242C|nr:jacalin-like lectin [Brevibacillus laterosporus]MED1663492.1 jacalin-like lectin [Brevibacillus laterosporus]MED1671006.1 jacalin-like lectin [Brevibacillus laterosporus]MED1718261.1 jacalin-like lectin [Brevibacillus laterosporus]PPA88785.1 jacalin-like lectin domain protein [Brevibacillus laterosporus]
MSWRKSTLFGGSGGSPFNDDHTDVKRLAGFYIRHGSRIDAIQGIYDYLDGRRAPQEFHGGNGGTQAIVFFEDDEHIIRITGRTGSRVDQLTITTNKRTYGSYGGNGGSPFEIDAANIGGFFGRSGSEIDAIGFFIPTS